MSMNKQGKIFLYLLLVALLFGFLYMFSEATDTLTFTHMLGDSAGNLQSLQWDIALNQTLLDAQARLAVATAKQAFFANGGFYNVSPCGTLGTSNVWLRDEKLCLPDVLSNYTAFLADAFPQFFHEPYKIAVLPEKRSNHLAIYALLPQPVLVNHSPQSLNLSENQAALQMQWNKNTVVYDTFEQTLFTNLSHFLPLAKACNDKACVTQAVNAYNDAFAYPLQTSCATGKAKLAASFLNHYLHCLDSYQAACLCTFSLEGDDRFTFVLKNNSVVIGDTAYIHYTNTSDYYTDKRLHADNITIRYEKGKFDVTLMIDGRKQTKSFSSLTFYKDWDDALLPVLQESLAEQKPQCQVPEYLEFTFCTETKEKHLVLDPYEQAIAFKTLPLSFSIVLLPKQPPKALTVVIAEDMPKEENAVRVRFMPDNDPQVVYYRLYYADHPFTDTKEATFYDEIFLPDPQEGLYETTMQLEDGKQWWVAVAPQNVYKVENTHVQSVAVTPIDDVAPGPVAISSVSVPYTKEHFGIRFPSASQVEVVWEAPSLNENGRPVHDVQGYYLFTAQQPFSELPSLVDPEACKQQSGCAYTPDTIFTFTGLPQGDIYLVIVGVDEAGNYLKQPTVVTAPGDLIWPAEGPLSSCYGWRDLSDIKHDWHHGIDIAVPYGTPVKAVADGVVESVCINPKNTKNRRSERICHGFGTNVILYHEHLGTYSRYNHLARAFVVKGQKVKQGDIIGLVGNTGYSENTHLDFKYFKSKNFAEKPGNYEENPLCYLPPNTFGFTSDANSCRDSDGDGTNACPVLFE